MTTRHAPFKTFRHNLIQIIEYNCSYDKYRWVYTRLIKRLLRNIKHLNGQYFVTNSSIAKSLKKFFTNDANYAQHHDGITLDNGATLVVKVMEMVYFTHDPEILRLTDQHGIKATEIAVSKTEDTLDQSHEVAEFR